MGSTDTYPVNGDHEEYEPSLIQTGSIPRLTHPSNWFNKHRIFYGWCYFSKLIQHRLNFHRKGYHIKTLAGWRFFFKMFSPTCPSHPLCPSDPLVLTIDIPMVCPYHFCFSVLRIFEEAWQLEYTHAGLRPTEVRITDYEIHIAGSYIVIACYCVNTTNPDQNYKDSPRCNPLKIPSLQYTCWIYVVINYK